MRKTAFIIALCGILACSAASCGSRNSADNEVSESAEAETEPVTEEPTESPEEVDEQSKNAIRDYYEAFFAGQDEKAGNLRYTSNIVDYFKKNDTLRMEMGMALIGHVSAELGDITFSSCRQLSDTTLKGAETFYERYSKVFCNDELDITVLDGREIEFTVTAVSGDSSDSETYTYVVVKTAEEGYKIITTDANEVNTLAD